MPDVHQEFMSIADAYGRSLKAGELTVDRLGELRAATDRLIATLQQEMLPLSYVAAFSGLDTPHSTGTAALTAHVRAMTTLNGNLMRLSEDLNTASAILNAPEHLGNACLKERCRVDLDLPEKPISVFHLAATNTFHAVTKTGLLASWDGQGNAIGTLKLDVQSISWAFPGHEGRTFFVTEQPHGVLQEMTPDGEPRSRLDVSHIVNRDVKPMFATDSESKTYCLCNGRNDDSRTLFVIGKDGSASEITRPGLGLIGQIEHAHGKLYAMDVGFRNLYYRPDDGEDWHPFELTGFQSRPKRFAVARDTVMIASGPKIHLFTPEGNILPTMHCAQPLGPPSVMAASDGQLFVIHPKSSTIVLYDFN